MSRNNQNNKACCKICSNRAKEGYCKEIQSDRFGKKAEDEHYCRMFKQDVSQMFNGLFGDMFGGGNVN